MSRLLQQARESRTYWRLLKVWPNACAGVLNNGAVTPSQWVWIQGQLLLDEGIQACPDCDALSAGEFCPACGKRVREAARVCEECHSAGHGAYCVYCGAPLGSALADAIAAETFDWVAWAQSLQPFLGGLTPQEEALLARG